MNRFIPINSFVQFFKDCLPKLQNTYSWPVSVKAKAALPEFQWHKESGRLNECIDLKHHLTHAWANADEAKKRSLASWIVSEWGGVRSNKPTTLDSYLKRGLDENEVWPLKGVASYSKILSVVDCLKYAIYDARVAACLNAIQLYMDCQEPVFFHYVPSRNKAIQGNNEGKGFIEIFSKRELVGSRGWYEIEKEATYLTYLQLLHNVKYQLPNTEIYHLEMLLFSLSLDLCKSLVMEKTNDGNAF